MAHSFDENIATEYGVNEAILFNYITFWVKQNTLNNQNCFEGRHWTYNSISTLAGLFPYMSRETIKRALSHLKDEGLILIGSFSNDKFKKVNYYTLSDEASDILQKRHNRVAQNEPTESVIMSQPNDTSFNNINNSNTVITNTDITLTASPVLTKEQKIDLLFEEFWKAYPNRRKYNKPGCRAKYRHIPDIEKVHPDIMSALEIHKKSNDWTKDNGQYIPAPYVYLNQERWKLVDTRDEKQVMIDEITKEYIDTFLL